MDRGTLPDTDLVRLFADVLAVNEQAMGVDDLPELRRRAGDCSRLQSVLAARHAAFTPALRRLERAAAQIRPTQPAGDDTSTDTGSDPDDGAPGDGQDGIDPDGTDGDASGSEDTATPDAPAADGSDDRSGPAPSSQPEPEPEPRVSAAEQWRRERRARWLAVFEHFAAALAAGRISTDHADVLAIACERLDEWTLTEVRTAEPTLLATARRLAPEALRDELTDLVETIRADGGRSTYQHQLAESRAWIRQDRTTGMYHLGAVFDPLRGEAIQSILDQYITRLRRDPDHQRAKYEQVAAQALADLLTHDIRITPHVVAVIDEQTAITGRQHEHTVCENIDGARLPIDVVRQACLIAGNITAAVLDRAGKPADLAAHQALATVEQRYEIRAMGNTCVHPDCDRPFSRCEIHHVTFRTNHGATIVSNLVAVCPRHHHDIHDRGWTLTIDTNRTLTWRRPDGTLHAEVHHSRLDHQPLRQPDTATCHTQHTRPPGAPPGRRTHPATGTHPEADPEAATVPTGSAAPDRRRPAA